VSVTPKAVMAEARKILQDVGFIWVDLFLLVIAAGKYVAVSTRVRLIRESGFLVRRDQARHQGAKL
jgi:hypothetical protein